VSSESDIDPTILKHRTIEQIARTGSQIGQVGDDLRAELSENLYKGLRAATRAVVHSFKVWAERSK